MVEQTKSPYLSFEDGIVTAGGKELPGLLVQLTVAGEVKFDESKTDGQSGKKKTPLGFEDAVINLDLELLTDDEEVQNGTSCYEKLAAIDQLFKGVGAKAAPKILTVTNRHLRARRINQVVFSGLASRETNQDDVILAALTFTEHLPPVTTAEKRVVGAALDEQKKKAEEAKKNAPSAKPQDIKVGLE